MMDFWSVVFILMLLNLCKVAKVLIGKYNWKLHPYFYMIKMKVFMYFVLGNTVLGDVGRHDTEYLVPVKSRKTLFLFIYILMVFKRWFEILKCVLFNHVYSGEKTHVFTDKG